MSDESTMELKALHKELDELTGPLTTDRRIAYAKAEIRWAKLKRASKGERIAIVSPDNTRVWNRGEPYDFLADDPVTGEPVALEVVESPHGPGGGWWIGKRHVCNGDVVIEVDHSPYPLGGFPDSWVA